MFIASKLLALLAQPLVWAISLLVLALLSWQRRPQRARKLVGAGLVILVLVGWEPLPDYLIRQLESQYVEISPFTKIGLMAQGVVVLGGALEPSSIAQSHAQPALNAAAERMSAAVALAQRYPEVRMVFTGGEGDLFGHGISEAQRAAQFFISMGVLPERVVYEDVSRNTYENAILTAQLPGIDKTQTWLLLTSAWHMPRAMATFRAAGWNVIAYPVDFRTGDTTPWTMYSLPRGVEKWQLALREYIGLVGYWVAGRS